MKIINMLIQIIENIIKFFVCKILRIDLSDDMCYKIMQFVKFGLVGLSNVIVSYVIYVIVLLLFQRFNLFVDTDYIIAQIVGYVISIFWSFYLNNKYVFKSELKTSWIAALIKSFVAYSFTGIIMNSVLSYIWVEMIGINKMIAPIINLLINVPVNFVLNKFWAFDDK